MEKKGALKESNKWVWKKNGEMVGGRRGWGWGWVEREALVTMCYYKKFFYCFKKKKLIINYNNYYSAFLYVLVIKTILFPIIHLFFLEKK